jgi:hypothetical protein
VNSLRQFEAEGFATSWKLTDGLGLVILTGLEDHVKRHGIMMPDMDELIAKYDSAKKVSPGTTPSTKPSLLNSSLEGYIAAALIRFFPFLQSCTQTVFVSPSLKTSSADTSAYQRYSRQPGRLRLAWSKSTAKSTKQGRCGTSWVLASGNYLQESKQIRHEKEKNLGGLRTGISLPSRS